MGIVGRVTRWIERRGTETRICRECEARTPFVAVTEEGVRREYCARCGTTVRVRGELSDEQQQYLRDAGERFW